MLAQSRRARVIVACLWAIVIGIAFAWGHFRGFGPAQMILIVYRFVNHHAWGPLLYLLLYALRPIILFPAMWLTITSGSLFGFWGGWAVAIVGENLSANTAYWLARFVGGEAASQSEKGLIARWRTTLQEHAIATVVILRAAYLPFDPVNFVCGFLAVPWIKYTVGTFIGIMPPMVTFVSFGASIDIENLLTHPGSFSATALFHTQQLFVSIGLLVASVGLAAVFHLRHRRRLRTQHRRSR